MAASFPVRWCFAALGLAAAISSPLLAQDEAKTFQSKYGEDLKRVRATRETTDDRELAAKLIKAADAENPAPAPEMVAVLCDYAFTLASAEAEGYPLAERSMEVLAQRVPGKESFAQQKVISLYQRQFTRAKPAEKNEFGNQLIDVLSRFADRSMATEDFVNAKLLYTQAKGIAKQVKTGREQEIEDRLEQLASRERVGKEIARWLKKLEEMPSDAAAHRELLKLYVVTLDDPGAAMAHLDLGGDEAAKKLLPLARKADNDIPVADLLPLARWYQGWSESANADTRARVLLRAERYLTLFLVKHDLNDEARADAVKRRGEVETELDKIVSTRVGWVDVLKHATLSGDRWKLDGSKLIGAPDSSNRTGINVLVKGSYRLRVEFEVLSGDVQDGVMIHLPVGSYSAWLCLGRESHRIKKSGLAMVDGQSVEGRPVKLEPEKRHVVDVTVQVKGKNADIAADFNDDIVVRWSGLAASLQAPDGFSARSPQHLAVANYRRRVVFHSFKVRMMNGTLEVDPPKKN